MEKSLLSAKFLDTDTFVPSHTYRNILHPSYHQVLFQGGDNYNLPNSKTNSGFGLAVARPVLTFAKSTDIYLSTFREISPHQIIPPKG